MGKRPYRFLSILSIAALPFIGSSCATFVKFSAEGTGAANTFVRVNSVPQGIQGTLDNGRTFTTPVNLVLESDRKHTLTFAKEGSEPIVVDLVPDRHNWVWGNVLSLGFGCIVDSEKGSNRIVNPDEVLITFEQEREDTAPEPEPEPEPAADTTENA